MSDVEAEGMEMHLLSQRTEQSLLAQVDEHNKENVQYQRQFFNMSSLGQLHPEILGNLAYLDKEREVNLPFDVQETDVWSFGRSAKTPFFCRLRGDHDRRKWPRHADSEISPSAL